ncbi:MULTISPECIES: hypothetical protein [unclassified Scytonema]|uniref:hypothetical protein n=1 Tax=unclassified Scytonema TaxID=2618749 RepID=UPI0013013075|nr:hypothetical protein [Scytonema sp. HK-05]
MTKLQQPCLRRESRVLGASALRELQAVLFGDFFVWCPHVKGVKVAVAWLPIAAVFF